MKKILKYAGIWIGLSFLMTFYWILSLVIAGTIIPANMPDAPPESTPGTLMLFIISALNSAILLLFIYNSTLSRWKLVFLLFLITFGLQYFLSQIETIWFNDALQMDPSLIGMVVLGGAISILAFSITATWVTGRFKKAQNFHGQIPIEKSSILKWIGVHALCTWPIIYFLAGYFIAWQFSEVRAYYTGSTAMDSFVSIMKGNITSGLYFFQIFRGLIWIAIGYLVLISVEGSARKKGIILGLLFSVISSSQLLLPNPIMPEMVRIAHLIETSTSNLIWGFILAYTLDKFIDLKSNES